MEGKARTTTIRATSRASVKIKDNFFTLEFCEERSVPEGLDDAEIAVERDILWKTVNDECDNQISMLLESYR